jgi:hypothetical protein
VGKGHFSNPIFFHWIYCSCFLKNILCCLYSWYFVFSKMLLCFILFTWFLPIFYLIFFITFVFCFSSSSVKCLSK